MVHGTWYMVHGAWYMYVTTGATQVLVHRHIAYYSYSKVYVRLLVYQVFRGIL